MPKDFSDVLTDKEVKLIQEALKLAYKPRLIKLVEHNAEEAEKKHPLGTHGSIKAYTQGDGLEVELAALEMMKQSKNKATAELGNKIYDEMIHAGVLNTGTGTNNAKARSEIIAMEDASPMAPTFKVARKLQQNGSKGEDWKGYPKGF